MQVLLMLNFQYNPLFKRNGVKLKTLKFQVLLYRHSMIPTPKLKFRSLVILC